MERVQYLKRRKGETSLHLKPKPKRAETKLTIGGVSPPVGLNSGHLGIVLAVKITQACS